ncbi:uncharacterized protein A1O9_09841 [Exophiala aquamarina CBS 119918]|uniref:RRM domain-containing protein n=1 Tax=Exophiala aquamarina CBS 119918 TaxID=1182545 RepID=A0A072P2F7_9EURO|nr:uncharacterized protein A1O9_09841 [Exophiala aquamarina CBS 119918]KEF54046.1 hypothetical protein A1O9_09841 [Exophiala aquamarina CBS 119918]
MSNQSKGRSGGVLPVSAAARKNVNPSSTSKPGGRTPALKLRLCIRRLPPGLTESEFWTALGETWNVGGSKVEWAAFKDGKISRDPAKPSRPSRAYLKIKEQSLLDELSTTLKQISFQDAKNTAKDACLLGPPSLEFAPYNKIPTGRARHDGRQGTIDQDQEFIDFLQRLTEPITRSGINGTDANDNKAEKSSTTPLVQYIKEKKANKAKEASQAKAAKARESKEGKTPKSESRSTVVIKGRNAPTAEKERVAKVTQDAVNVINKPAAAIQGGKQAPSKTEVKQEAKEKEASASQPATPKKERERGNASAAARMLQRDLGLLPKESKAQRAAKRVATPIIVENTCSGKTPPAASKSERAKNDKEKEKENLPATPTTSNPPTGPRASRTPSAASTSAKTASTPSQRPSKSSQSSAGAKSAFLKHANPSQGITEDTLQTTFKQFGTITRCEIDKKKGLGYIDFSEPEGLKKAMQASPVKVGNGQVVVLENKNSQGGGKRGGGQQKEPTNKAATAVSTPAASQAQVGQAPSTPTAIKSPVVKSATPATSTPTLVAATAAATETTAATIPAASADTPPTAPRGSARNGGRGGRGGSGGGAGRASNRGPGQGSRGRSGGGRGNSRRGGAAAGANASSNVDGGASTATAAATPAASSGGPTPQTKKP